MSMSEIINVYSKDSQNIKPQDRAIFYDSQVAQKNSEIEDYVELVAVFIVNSRGEVILQKRSNSKRHNPNMLDKAIGGHVVHGDSVDYTVMVETLQELQTPSIVLRSEEDFIKTKKLLANYLDTICIIKHIDSDYFELTKKLDGSDVKIGNFTHVFFGVYNGKVRPADREARGILYY